MLYNQNTLKKHLHYKTCPKNTLVALLKNEHKGIKQHKNTALKK